MVLILNDASCSLVVLHVIFYISNECFKFSLDIFVVCWVLDLRKNSKCRLIISVFVKALGGVVLVIKVLRVEIRKLFINL